MASSSETLQVAPGAIWTDTNTGSHIQAHGAGFIVIDGTYYIIGEDKSNGTFFHNINCYSSKDFVRWRFEGSLLAQTASGDLGPQRIVERPKVIHNDRTDLYVMYMHIDSSDYQDARVGVATSQTLTGKYTYRGSFRPNERESRDIGLFKDEDGSAYLLTEDRESGLRIAALSEDYLTVESEVYRWAECIESPAIWKTGGYYYMLGSYLTGWDANDNVYSYATSLAGPWSPWKMFADPGSKTYESQSSAVLPFGETAIYLGDRWCPSNLSQSTYIWLPLDKNGSDIYLKNRSSWTIDAKSQTWNEVRSEVEHTHDTAAASDPADFSCAIHSSVTTLTTVCIRYTNEDSKNCQAEATLNNVKYLIDLAPTGRAKQGVEEVGRTVLHLSLTPGQRNVVSILLKSQMAKVLGIVTLKDL